MKKVLAVVLAAMLTTMTIGCSKGEEKKEEPQETKKELTLEEKIDKKVSEMSLEEKVGQIMMPYIDKTVKDNKVVDFTEMNDSTKNVIEKYHLGGVILFKNNMKSKEQTKKLNEDLINASGELGLFIGTDEEGGLVTRIPTENKMPVARKIGETGKPEEAYKVGNSIAKELKELGINMDFAPVMDVDTNPNNPVIGKRSFGNKAEIVTEFGLQYMKGLNDEKIISSVKHFPGHGDTAGDSHKDLVRIDHDKDRINKVELEPFRQAIKNKADVVMVSHIQVPAIDNTKVKSNKANKEIIVPATFSSKLLKDTLRTDMGFEGVIITDALNMGAIANYFTPKEAAILTLKAGTDILLMPAPLNPGQENKLFDECFNGIVEAVKSGDIEEKQLDASVKRILNLKNKYEVIKM